MGRIVESFDGDQQAENSLRFQAGLISSVLEHAVPEQMFSDPDNPTDGVSAVKALQLAAQQGQKIYQIDGDNLYTALGDIAIGPEVENEIRQAVLNGKIAITHQSNIQVPGWSGAGYLILDPDLVDGSYKISGGGNGGELEGSALSIVGILGAFLSMQKLAASTSDDGSATESIFNLLAAFFDELADTKILGPISLILGSLSNIQKIDAACSGLAQAVNIFMLITFTVIPFLVFGLATGFAALVYFYLVGLLLSLVVDRIVEGHIKVNCTDE